MLRGIAWISLIAMAPPVTDIHSQSPRFCAEAVARGRPVTRNIAIRRSCWSQLLLARTGNRLPCPSAGLLAVTSLSGQRVLLIQPSAGEATIYADSAFAGVGRVRDIVRGPDGFLYVSTSNRDGRGQPTPEDDRILRLRPLSPRPE